MKLSRLNSILREAELRRISQNIEYLQQQPTFITLSKLLGPKFAKDLSDAYVDDIRSYARTNGQRFESLAANILKDNTISRMYRVPVVQGSELQRAIHTLAELVKTAFPTSGFHAGGANVTIPDPDKDVWAHNELRYQR